MAKMYNAKRQDYISWQDYFMGIAKLTALRSKDPSTQVGACIVSEDNRIVSMGYNGFPNGCDDDYLPWDRGTSDDPETSKYFYVVHAEMNAILNAGGSSLKGCHLYVSLFPCNECAKAIIQSGIKKVYYEDDKYNGSSTNIAAKKMFDMAGVICEQISCNIIINNDGKKINEKKESKIKKDLSHKAQLDPCMPCAFKKVDGLDCHNCAYSYMDAVERCKLYNSNRNAIRIKWAKSDIEYKDRIKPSNADLYFTQKIIQDYSDHSINKVDPCEDCAYTERLCDSCSINKVDPCEDCAYAERLCDLCVYKNQNLDDRIRLLKIVKNRRRLEKLG